MWEKFFRIIAIFMVVLILFGSALGWNMDSYDGALRGFRDLTNTINTIGVGTMKVVSFAGGFVGGAVSDIFGGQDYDLPTNYRYAISGEIRRMEMSLYGALCVAYKRRYGKECPSRSYPVISDECALAVYHSDIYAFVNSDDRSAYVRLTSAGYFNNLAATFCWFFRRQDMKDNFNLELLKCEDESHDHAKDIYDTIASYDMELISMQ